MSQYVPVHVACVTIGRHRAVCSYVRVAKSVSIFGQVVSTKNSFSFRLLKFLPVQDRPPQFRWRHQSDLLPVQQPRQVHIHVGHCEVASVAWTLCEIAVPPVATSQ